MGDISGPRRGLGAHVHEKEEGGIKLSQMVLREQFQESENLTVTGREGRGKVRGRDSVFSG